MRVISKSNASSLPWQGVTYEPGPDGVFELPEPVGVELTTKHASMWVAEAVHLAAMTAAQIDSLRNPNFMVTAVADLIGRVAELEKKLTAPTPAASPAPAEDIEGSDPEANTSGSQDPDPEESASDAPPADPGEQVEEPKLTAAQKRAAAKKAAAAEAPVEPDPGTGGE